jgi:membrane-associated phospholipid phosphatase
LKKIVCAPRPISVFNPGEFNIIPGIYTAAKYSFPSGHTTTVFAAASLFVLLYNDKRINLILLVVAILVGFSRIYLGQHFLEDVIFGALLGTVSSLVVYNTSKNIYKTKNTFSLR